MSRWRELILSKGQDVCESSGLKGGDITRMSSESDQPGFLQSKLRLLKLKAEALIPETKTHEKSPGPPHVSLEDLSKSSACVKTLDSKYSRTFYKVSDALVSQRIRGLRAKKIFRIF